MKSSSLAITCLAAIVFPASAFPADPKTATVTFISEPVVLKRKEFVHSAILIEYADGKREWLGFMPGKPGQPGVIDPSDRTEWVDSFVRFTLDEEKVRAARKAAVAKFEKQEYKLLVTDCVSFTSEFARQAGLKVAAKPNLIPKNLVANLAKGNDGLKPTHDPAVTPKSKLPWR